MRIFSLFTAFILSFPNVAPSQQATTSPSASSTQANALLTQSLTAQTGTATLSDVTLSGTARRIAGSDDETGSATLKAIAGDAGRMDLSLPSGPRSEILNSTTAPPTGSWSGPDGVSHPMADHNLLTDSAWFFPAFTVGRLLASGNSVVSYIGQETKNGHSVYHISAFQQFPQMSAKTASLAQHLTQTEIFLDASTLLPLAFDFNTHPDDNAGLDMPVELLFSDYRIVNGAQIPFHVQKFLNSTLMLDLQFQTATLNSGLSASSFSL
jgi:hypothetical protein